MSTLDRVPVRRGAFASRLLASAILFANAWFVATAANPAKPSDPSEHAPIPGERIEGQVDTAGGMATLTFRGKPIAIYAFAATQFKPYLKALYTLRGENVLRDAPADHLHHHGLMYACRVNGLNFWEEGPTAGRQISVGPPNLELEPGASGPPRAILTQTILWQPAGGDSTATALLREVRRLTISVNTGIEEVAVEWDARFELGSATNLVVLEGANYNGLGARLPREFDRVARFENSNGLAYSEAQTGDIRPSVWTSAAGSVEGRDVMAVLAAAPGNPGHSTFFTMRNPFAYVSATQDLSSAPLTYRSGETWRLRYLLLVYPAHQNVDYLGQRLAPWLKNR